tara:strand:+ start:430 stop:606 length:177 start_codon:yes stop_codon:yes gene_type:complete
VVVFVLVGVVRVFTLTIVLFLLGIALFNLILEILVGVGVVDMVRLFLVGDTEDFRNVD